LRKEDAIPGFTLEGCMPFEEYIVQGEVFLAHAFDWWVPRQYIPSNIPAGIVHIMQLPFRKKIHRTWLGRKANHKGIASYCRRTWWLTTGHIKDFPVFPVKIDATWLQCRR